MTMNWIVVAGLIAAALALLIYLIWLIKWRRRIQIQARRREELKQSLEELGLRDFWETRVYNARIFGVAGALQKNSLRIELWEGDRKSFMRLTSSFSRQLRQGIRVRTRTPYKFGLRWRQRTFTIGDEEFDEVFIITSATKNKERAKALLNTTIRTKLLNLAKKVEIIEIDDRRFYIYCDQSLEGTQAAELIKQVIQISELLEERAAEVGPAEATAKTEYEVASKKTLGREIDQEA